MNVCSVRLKNFRNHDSSVLDFGDGVNVLVGNNGQGKTSVLEAISYLSLTKSFYATSDEAVLQIGKEWFELDGKIRTATGSEHVIRCMYHHAPHEKVFTINAAAPETLSSVIGRFPVVVLSPENSTITSGAPAERRKFLDLILSQVSHAYFEDLMEYRRVLKQRNKILSEWRQLSAQRYEMLEPWDLSLVSHGSRITQRRQTFVGEIAQYVKNAYAQLVDVDEEPSLQYGSNVRGLSPSGTVDEIAAMMKAGIEQHRHEEFRRGVSLVGPHRDDVRLVLSEKAVKEYASQGQHKTFLVALKLAEFFYMRERKQEPPIFLLDDVFSELDASRTERILRQLSGLGQTILTTTDEMVFHDAVRWSHSCRRFYLENGACRAA